MTSTTPPRRQCAKCPWKVSVDPNLIPNGYSRAAHAALRGTIAPPDPIAQLLRSAAGKRRALRIMACHESPVGAEVACVGWLENQLGPGNNLVLRMSVGEGRIDANVETVGPQHETFEATLAAGAPLACSPDTLHPRETFLATGLVARAEPPPPLVASPEAIEHLRRIEALEGRDPLPVEPYPRRAPTDSAP